MTHRGKAKYLGGVGTKVTGISRRQFRPNLQTVHVTTANGTPQDRPRLHPVHPQRRGHQEGPPRPVPAAQDGREEMSLSRAEVEKVSLLGRLLLSDAELDTMTDQLGDILGYIESARRGRHGAGRADGPRAGRVRTSSATTARGRASTAKQALANAPHRDDECYLVPAVLGEV